MVLLGHLVGAGLIELGNELRPEGGLVSAVVVARVLGTSGDLQVFLAVCVVLGPVGRDHSLPDCVGEEGVLLFGKFSGLPAGNLNVLTSSVNFFL